MTVLVVHLTKTLGRMSRFFKWNPLSNANRRRLSFSRWGFAPIAAVLYVVMTACTTEPTPTVQGSFLASINIPDYSAWVGETVPIAAAAETGFFVFTGPVIDLKCKWTTSNPAVFTIVSDGTETTQAPKLKMVGPGTATLTVTVEDSRIDPTSNTQTATAKVTVTETGTLKFSPRQATMTVGDTKNFTVGFVGASGQSVANPRYIFDFQVSGAGLSIVGNVGTTTLADPPVVAVKANSAGSARVIARAFLVSDKFKLGSAYFEDTAFVTMNAAIAPTRVTVDPTSVSLVAGATRQLSATVFDQFNAVINGATVQWLPDNTSVATVSTSGLLKGESTNGADSAKVKVIVRAATGVEATVNATVYRAVSTVLVSPNPMTMQAGSTHTFTYQLKASNNNDIPLNATSVTWSTTNPSIATVNQSGVVSALSSGTTKVAVITAEGVGGSADLTVEAVPLPTVVRVIVTPASVTLKLSDAKCQFTAKAFDANGNEVQVTGFRWLIDDSSLANIDATGLVTFKKAGGPTAIRAFYGNDANAPGGAGSLTINPNP